MESVKQVIDKAAKVCGSKKALAERLGVSPQRMWDYESGFRAIPDEKLIEIAHIAGANPIRALGEYAWERHTKKKGSASVGTAAVVCFLAVFLDVVLRSLPIMNNECYPKYTRAKKGIQRLLAGRGGEVGEVLGA